MNEVNSLANVTLFPGTDAQLLHAIHNQPAPRQDMGVVMEMQRSLQPETVVATFCAYLRSTYAIENTEYSLIEFGATYSHGKRERAQLVYRLGLEDLSLGEIVFSRKQRFNDGMIRDIEDSLAMLLYPLRNAVQYQQALRSAHKDPLTGLANRLGMESGLRREIDLSNRHEDPFSLLMVDMDGFKHINDQFGHAAGDKALVLVANLLSSRIRNTDLLFRFAGDEFIVGLCKTDIYGATLLAKRLLDSVNNASFVVGGKRVPLRLSVGGAVLRKGDDIDSLFQRADGALYDAKNSGRNAVAFAEYLE